MVGLVMSDELHIVVSIVLVVANTPFDYYIFIMLQTGPFFRVFQTRHKHFAGHHYGVRHCLCGHSICALTHCLTFVYSFEALRTDGKVCGKPQGQYRSTADYGGRQHES